MRSMTDDMLSAFAATRFAQRRGNGKNLRRMSLSLPSPLFLQSSNSKLETRRSKQSRNQNFKIQRAARFFRNSWFSDSNLVSDFDIRISAQKSGSGFSIT